MRHSELKNIFVQAQDKLIRDFSAAKVSRRVNKAEVVITSSLEMVESLGSKSFYSASCVSAYYDPNSHRVYLNMDIFSKVKPSKAFNICYHELVHAATKHRVYTHNKARIFQSGAKIEVFEKGSYKCFNRALNEGIVEFLSTGFNHNKQGAYRREVGLVQIIAQKFGASLLKEAILDADLEPLKEKFDQYYGEGSLDVFSKLMDTKRFSEAQEIIENGHLQIFA